MASIRNVVITGCVFLLSIALHHFDLLPVRVTLGSSHPVLRAPIKHSRPWVQNKNFPRFFLKHFILDTLEFKSQLTASFSQLNMKVEAKYAKVVEKRKIKFSKIREEIMENISKMERDELKFEIREVILEFFELKTCLKYWSKTSNLSSKAFAPFHLPGWGGIDFDELKMDLKSKTENAVYFRWNFSGEANGFKSIFVELRFRSGTLLDFIGTFYVVFRCQPFSKHCFSKSIKMHIFPFFSIQINFINSTSTRAPTDQTNTKWIVWIHQKDSPNFTKYFCLGPVVYCLWYTFHFGMSPWQKPLNGMEQNKNSFFFIFKLFKVFF